MREEDSFRPLAAVGLAIMLFSVMDALVKFVAADFATWQIVLLRYGFGLAIIAPVYALRERALPRRTTMRDSAIRGVTAMITALTFFYALSLIPLVKAVALSFSAPLFMIVVARIVLHEPITTRALAAILLGSAGVVIMLWKPLMAAGGAANLIGEFAVLLSGLFYALSVVLTRLHGQRDNAHSMVFTQSLCISLYTLPLGLWAWRPLDGTSTLLFMLIAFLGTMSTLLMAWGFARAAASRLSALEYTNLIWTSILGYALFAEIPTGYTVTGAAFIVIASMLAARRAPRPAVQADAGA